jgi:hypothetical protein
MFNNTDNLILIPAAILDESFKILKQLFQLKVQIDLLGINNFLKITFFKMASKIEKNNNSLNRPHSPTRHYTLPID